MSGRCRRDSHGPDVHVNRSSRVSRRRVADEMLAAPKRVGEDEVLEALKVGRGKVDFLLDFTNQGVGYASVGLVA